VTLYSALDAVPARDYLLVGILLVLGMVCFEWARRQR
jgi:hypothetical protein